MLLVGALVAALIPGLGEIGEAAIHLIETGHVAHASGTRGGVEQRSDAEHGCSGTFHVCGCCGRPAFAEAPLLRIRPPRHDRSAAPLPSRSPVTEAHERELARPPRAL
jgi:hypothetical protein